jgi:hypothetical protein
VASLLGVVAGSPLFLGHLKPGMYILKISTPDLKINKQFKIVKL